MIRITIISNSKKELFQFVPGVKLIVVKKKMEYGFSTE